MSTAETRPVTGAAEVLPGALPGPADPAERVAAAATAVPGVLRLHPGAFGEVATYLPGRRVAGVRLHQEGPVEVHVVVALRSDLQAVARAVHDAVRTVTTREVHVVVADVD